MKRFFEDNGFFDDFLSVKVDKSSVRKPLLEIRDTGDHLKIIAELPGVNKDDIDIDVEDQNLILKSEAKQEKEKTEENKYYSERRYSSFYRQIPLPVEIIPEKTEASFKNGILEIDLLKKEPTKKKDKKFKVEIKWFLFLFF